MNERSFRKTRRLKRTHRLHLSSIPIQVPVSNFSSKKQQGDDFYTWVNGKWLDSTRIPPTENEYSISDEVEESIFTVASKLITDSKYNFLHNLAESCLHPHVKSLEFLKDILQSVRCVKTKEDVIEHFAVLSKAGMESIFSIESSVTVRKATSICLNSGFPSLKLPYYGSSAIMHCYKTLLEQVGSSLDLPELYKILPFEKSMAFLSDSYWTEEKHTILGRDLCKKFRKVPWAIFFKTLGLEEWKTMNFCYCGPKWIRHLGKMLEEVPIDTWKLFLVRCYILESIRYLPAPFNDFHYEFFGKCIQGQQEKKHRMDTLVNIVYDFCPDEFSQILWNSYGDTAVLQDVTAMCKTLKAAAKKRFSATEWLGSATRIAGIHKIDSMVVSAVRPTVWPPIREFELEPDNLLQNIFTLGNRQTELLFSRVGEKRAFWEDGIYRVNAYYFSENNEIVIPYGTVLSPFYNKDSGSAWNYGALGCVIGHEICHGFDNEGKEYDWNGQKRKWWTRRDNLAYNHKVKALVKSFGKPIIAGKHISGKNTLAENIADLGGIGISLEGLKHELTRSGITDHSELMKAYRDFFIAYATSWRTMYRYKKLESSIGVDKHAPAPLRVNLIVPHFDEWYEAFDIDSESELYIKPEDRIRIF